LVVLGRQIISCVSNYFPPKQQAVERRLEEFSDAEKLNVLQGMEMLAMNSEKVKQI
jgi:hypothetical protein